VAALFGGEMPPVFLGDADWPSQTDGSRSTSEANYWTRAGGGRSGGSQWTASLRRRIE
jgi:hypothetical protein